MATWVKRMDVYRDIPKDMTDQTLTGGAISITAVITIAYLFFSEFWMFLTPEISHEMIIDSTMDTLDKHAMLQINLNITMPVMPCAVVSVDAQDVMGSHIVDVGGKLFKTRLDRYGRVRVDSNGSPLAAEGGEAADQLGEGCNVHGTMVVKRVPGNFHVSAHAHAELLSLFFKNQPMNVSHIVNDLSFGEQSELASLAAVVNPLKGAYKNAALESTAQSGVDAKSFEYYISVVPTQYHRYSGPVQNSFQYVANSNDVTGRYRIPAVYFRYEISPVTVKFTQRRKSFSHFLVQVCAIIGGVFTVLGLVNSIAQGGIKRFKKAELNKLG